MNREEKLREELEEAWFALLMEKIAKEEGAELNALNEQLKNDPAYAVPDEVTKRGLQTIRTELCKDRKRKTWAKIKKISVKVACVAAIMSAMMVTAYATIPDFKTAALNLLIQASDVSTRLVMTDEEVNKPQISETQTPDREPKILMGYQIPEMPDEYVIVSEQQEDNNASIRYANSDGESIRFHFYFQASGAVDVDTEDTNSRPVIIHGYEGLLCEKNGMVQLVWNDQTTNTFIQIFGEGIDAAYIQELADGIVRKEK